jgi:uncharacterized protein HemY
VDLERVDEALLQGTRALEQGSWGAARAAFEAALACEESAEALEGLGLAVWFEGRPDEGIALRERAFAAYVKDKRCDQAARIAVWVSHQ